MDTILNSHGRRPRKVLHILNSATGGAALSTIGLIEFFRALGIGACAVCHTAGTASERDQLRDAVRGEVLFAPLYWWNKKLRARRWKRPLIEIKQLLATGGRRRSAARVAEFAAACAVDLIHTSTFMTPEGGMAARVLGLPHVWHIRELIGPGTPYRLPIEGPKLGNYLSAHCSKLIANSHTSASKVRDWVPRGMLEVVPNGIDLARFVPRLAAVERDRLVVGMVGSLTSRTKQHNLLVEAAALVDRRLPIEWRIYGHDPSDAGRRHADEYIDQIHAQIRRHQLADRFVWPGFIDDPAQIMSALDVLVHPSDAESFGRILVEAMAAGLPVVGFRGGGVGEIVNDGVTGLLAAPNDAAELARHIERLARDPALRQSYGRAGRRRAEECYSLTACAQGVLAVYEAAAGRPLGRSAPVRPVASDSSPLGTAT